MRSVINCTFKWIKRRIYHYIQLKNENYNESYTRRMIHGAMFRIVSFSFQVCTCVCNSVYTFIYQSSSSSGKTFKYGPNPNTYVNGCQGRGRHHIGWEEKKINDANKQWETQPTEQRQNRKFHFLAKSSVKTNKIVLSLANWMDLYGAECKWE